MVKDSIMGPWLSGRYQGSHECNLCANFLYAKGKLCEGTSTWGCCPGLQDLCQGRVPSATGAVPHLQHVHEDSEAKCNDIKVERTWGHLDKAREAPVGQRWLLAVHFRFEQVAELAPVSAKVQRQLKEVCQLHDFLISLPPYFSLSMISYYLQNTFFCSDNRTIKIPMTSSKEIFIL